MERLGAGVIGAGAFGTLHARKYASLADSELIGVYDADAARAAHLARELGAAPFNELDRLLEMVEVVTVATPAESHLLMSMRALSAGRHVYVEKPLAMTEAAGAALVAAAQAGDLVLACGHQERAVFKAMGLLGCPETARSITSVRRGTPNARNRDVSCVLDLMIHDLDLALALGGPEVSGVLAMGEFDQIVAEIAFSNGLTARLEASRIAVERRRTMRLEFSSGDVEVDFLAPSFENRTGFELNAGFGDEPAAKDPLGASLSAFLATVVGRSDRPLVTGMEGLAALRLARQVEVAAGLS